MALLRIQDIELISLCYTYPPERTFSYAGGRCTGRLTSLVKLSTDAGITGIGSVYSHPDLVRLVVERQLRDILVGHPVGEDIAQIESIWNQMYALTRWYGRKGAAMSALGGVDMALWDILGKMAGKPIHELLGARRDRIPAYASGLLWKDDPAELAIEARTHLANGFRAMKIRIGRNLQYDRSAVHTLRDALGPENKMMVDCNARLLPEQAEKLASTLREAGVFWVEEPFPPENLEQYAALRTTLGIPVAAGENEFGVQGFRELIASGAVDIVQPDTCRAGGITEVFRVGQMAAARGLRVATHTWSDAVALTANMHVVASLACGYGVEIDQTGNPFIDELLTERLRVTNGEVELPRKPGLGIELNQDTLSRYTVPRGECFPDGNYSDMVFGQAYYGPAPPWEMIGSARS